MLALTAAFVAVAPYLAGAIVLGCAYAWYSEKDPEPPEDEEKPP